MATRLDAAQPLNHNTDAAFPHGAPRNNVSPDDGTGTKWNETWVKDIEALKQNLIIAAAITPSGIPDTAAVSQFATAIKTLTAPTPWTATTTGAVDLSASYPWARGARVYLVGGGGGGKSGDYLAGGGGGGSGGIRCLDLLVSDGFAWIFTVDLIGAIGTGGASPTNGGPASITLPNGTQWRVLGGDAGTATTGGDGHCGGGGPGYNATGGGNGGSFGNSLSTGVGGNGSGTAGTSAIGSLALYSQLGHMVSPQEPGAGGTGTSGSGGGGGGGHLALARTSVNGAAGDSGVSSGGGGGYGYGAGGGGGGGTNGAFLGAGGNGAAGLVKVVPF
jgi:hypothetical protein